jgi:hypothetical protein
MTLEVTPGTGQTIDTLDDFKGTAGSPNTRVLSVQGVASGTAVPVSAAALPLPTGAAAETTLGSVKTAVETLAGAVSSSKVATKRADGDDVALGAKADAAASTDDGTFSLIALVKRLLGYIAAIIAGTSAAAVKTGMSSVGVEFTKSSDTSYAVNDVVGPSSTAVINFPDVFRENAGSGYVVKVQMMTDAAANVGAYRLYLFHTAPTAIADSAAFTLLYADESKLSCYVDFPAMQTDGTGSTGAITKWTGSEAAKAAAADVDLYGVLVTKVAQTLVNGQKFTIRIWTDQN